MTMQETYRNALKREMNLKMLLNLVLEDDRIWLEMRKTTTTTTNELKKKPLKKSQIKKYKYSPKTLENVVSAINDDKC